MSPIFSRILGLVHAEDFQLAVIVAPKHVKNIEQINQSTLIHKTKQNKQTKIKKTEVQEENRAVNTELIFFVSFPSGT